MKENFNTCEVELSTDSLTSLSPEQESLFNIMENTDNNLLIIGGAGVGKSFSISYFRKHSKKKILVLAPTGVAALNVKGQTIHSVFRLKPTVQDVDDFNYLFKNSAANYWKNQKIAFFCVFICDFLLFFSDFYLFN